MISDIDHTTVIPSFAAFDDASLDRQRLWALWALEAAAKAHPRSKELAWLVEDYARLAIEAGQRDWRKEGSR